MECFKNHQVTHKVNRDGHLSDRQCGRSTNATTDQITSNSVQLNTFDLLDSLEATPRMALLFTKYPDLKQQLRIIYEMTIEQAAEVPLANSQSGSKRDGLRRGWTKERADQKALQYLHRVLKKDNGDGLNEFANLAQTLSGDGTCSKQTISR